MNSIGIRMAAIASIAGLGLLLLACGRDDSPAPGPASPATGEPTAIVATEVPTPMAEPPTATPVVAITDEELIAIAEAVYPGEAVYASCDVTVDGVCPVTSRLKARLADADVLLCRCQNGSATREIDVLPDRLEDGGGVVRVTMWEGNWGFDLVVVPVDGVWLVDDQRCAGRPETSIYDYAGPC